MGRIRRLSSAVFFALLVWALETELDPRSMSNRSRRLLASTGFGLLGLFAAFAIHGSGGDYAGLAFAGLWLGMALTQAGWMIPGFAAWFITLGLAGAAIGGRLLGLGAWSVLFAAGGLAVGAVILAALYVMAISRASQMMDEDVYGYCFEPRPPLITSERTFAAGLWLLYLVGCITAEQRYFDDNAAAALASVVCGTVLAMCLWGLTLAFMQRRTRASGFTPVTDDLWAPVGVQQKEAPEAPSVLT